MFSSFLCFTFVQIMLDNHVFRGFPGGSAGRESACSVGDLGSTPGLGRSPPTPAFLPGVSHGERSLVGPWVTKNWTLLSDWAQHTSGVVGKNPSASAGQAMWAQSLGQEDPPKKEMATHSSILAWKIPWTEGSSVQFGLSVVSDSLRPHGLQHGDRGQGENKERGRRI